jgi:hypothetical protein
MSTLMSKSPGAFFTYDETFQGKTRDVIWGESTSVSSFEVKERPCRHLGKTRLSASAAAARAGRPGVVPQARSYWCSM